MVYFANSSAQCRTLPMMNTDREGAICYLISNQMENKHRSCYILILEATLYIWVAQICNTDLCKKYLQLSNVILRKGHFVVMRSSSGLDLPWAPICMRLFRDTHH
jgi:hypothetical protein